MFDLLSKCLEYPPIYTVGTSSFWIDEHISQNLLKMHLDPDEELASRKLDFIERSVDWIVKTISPVQYPKLLDIGCGPGLYTQRFAKNGYAVIGIDFSSRSIEYARNAAKEQNMNINYLHQDYLEWETQDSYDIATMIYCDYGALSTENRKNLMGKIHDRLRPGGRLLLDVSSINHYTNYKEEQTWEIQGEEGFWCKERCICLSANRKYQDYTTLEQYVVMTQAEIKTYYIWNHCFTKQTLTDEASEAGFRTIQVYSDVAGQPYAEDSGTIAILLEK
jgi:SAM-dependent methyltransferase